MAVTAPKPLVIPRSIESVRLDECRIELAVQRREQIAFIGRVHGDATRVIRLLEGGLLAEAHSVAGGLLHATSRRAAQITASDDGTAA